MWRIGILQTDSIRDEWQAEFGDYPELFEALMRADQTYGSQLEFTVYDVRLGRPQNIDCDAYLITGSRHSVYDNFPWIGELVEFLHEVLAAGKKVVGICFGHQLFAHFFGGKVGKSDKGWGVGVYASEVVGEHRFLRGESSATLDKINLISSHQDQVLQLPPGAEVYLTNEFCPIAGYTMGDNVITMQGHPEFTPSYIEKLMSSRRDRIDADVIEAAIETLQQPRHAREVIAWALEFILPHETNSEALTLCNMRQTSDG